MRRASNAWMGSAVISIVISGCSKDAATPTSSAEPGARPGAVGAGGAGARVASDDDFVADVAMKNMAAIALSRMALDTSKNADIKSLAQRLIDDHESARNKLISAVSGTPIARPTQLDAKYTEMADELARTHGGEFDREYLEAMIDGHQDLAAKLESRIDVQSLTDWKTAVAAHTQSRAMPEPATAVLDTAVRPDKSGNETTTKINQWAADTYPVAQKHLDTARALEAATKR